MRVIPSTLLALLTAVAATAPALAQVRPTEPFGGRPFGAPPGTPAPDTQAPSTGTMGAPGTSSVTAPGAQNMGTPQTVIVAPVPVPAPPPPAPVPPHPAPTAAQAAIAPQSPQPTAAMQSPTPAIAPTAQAGGNAPAPAAASIAPPFVGANRNAPAGTAPVASTTQQPPVRGLPPDAPKLVISGAVYSPNRSQRMLIVNGQTVREGADLGQGVVLQEVRQEGAVLGFKGTNYNVMF